MSLRVPKISFKLMSYFEFHVVLQCEVMPCMVRSMHMRKHGENPPGVSGLGAN